MKKSILLPVLLLLTLCTYAQTVPLWITEPSIQYSRSSYLVAVGEGMGRQEAESNAISALSRVFGLSVALDARSQSRYAEYSGGAKTRFANGFRGRLLMPVSPAGLPQLM